MQSHPTFAGHNHLNTQSRRKGLMGLRNLGDKMDPDNRYSIHLLNMKTGVWENYESINLELVKKEPKKTLDEKITEYLDKCGVLTEQMRNDIRALIKEDEES